MVPIEVPKTDSNFLIKKVILNLKVIQKMYTIIINHRLSTYTSMNHSLLFSNLSEHTLNSLDTLSDIRINVFTLLF